MITVKLVGHIRTEVGIDELGLEDEELDPPALINRLRSMCKEPGFNEFNTLLMVEDSEAFVPAGSSKKLKGGDRVVVIPFSHGG